ncbi:hypothetical protein HPB51_026061 [Rhipicephalus microplus]|uniref:Uncharacterized protein n=1 Tax=Rhipicephalus microplus TaxID=6941 RepID=A0A9J6EF16_RHIMP|nr:hypothetical protein HPB51_026061 [Rhipicephalus microplus]
MRPLRRGLSGWRDLRNGKTGLQHALSSSTSSSPRLVHVHTETYVSALGFVDERQRWQSHVYQPSSELSNKCGLPTAVSPSKPPAPQDVVEDGRPLYLGSRRQQVTSGIFFLLLLLSWLAMVLMHVTEDHSADTLVRPPPSHMSDYPIPPDSGVLAFEVVANETVDTVGTVTSAVFSTVTSAVRSKVVEQTKSTPRLRKSACRDLYLESLAAAAEVTTVPTTRSRFDVHQGSASEVKKNLWCAYNGSDSRFKSHHLPLHLCSAVLLCCLTLKAPTGEPSANNLRFAEFLKLQDTNGNARPSLMVALGGPQQDPGVLSSLLRRDAARRLAVQVLRFVEFNRLDGVLLYTLHCGPDEVAIFRALYERLDYHGYTVAVTCPDGEGGPRMFADAKIGPVVLIPASVNASRTQCPIMEPSVQDLIYCCTVAWLGKKVYNLKDVAKYNGDNRGLARRVLDDGESSADVMLGVRLSGVRYTLPAGGEAITREGAAASLVSSAAYRDVCLAIKYAHQVALARAMQARNHTGNGVDVKHRLSVARSTILTDSSSVKIDRRLQHE